jgi:hypothetical protein
MNANISAEKPNKIINPPGPGVRALCAAFLLFPVVLGAILLIQSQHFDTLRTRFDTLRNDKFFPPGNPPPQKIGPGTAISPAIAAKAN